MIGFLALFNAGGLRGAASFKPSSGGGGGPTTVPSWIAAGTAGTGDGTADITPAYGSNNSGDLFLLQVAVRNGTTAPTVSGWTLRDGPDTLDNASHYWFTRDTRSSGSESGTVTVNSRGSSHIAVIHTFRNVATSSFFEGLTTNGSASDTSTINAPSVTSAGAARLFVAAGCFADNVTVGSFTGESNGDWVVRSSVGTGSGSNSAAWLQTADAASATTISGGSVTVGLTQTYTQHGFALVGT